MGKWLSRTSKHTHPNPITSLGIDSSMTLACAKKLSSHSHANEQDVDSKMNPAHPSLWIHSLWMFTLHSPSIKNLVSRILYKATFPDWLPKESTEYKNNITKPPTPTPRTCEKRHSVHALQANILPGKSMNSLYISILKHNTDGVIRNVDIEHGTVYTSEFWTFFLQELSSL